MRTSATESMYR